jgi:hypothetical protein
MTNEHDPIKEQDNKNEDDEFKRIESENSWREQQLKKVRNLKPVGPKAVTRPNFIPRTNMMRKVGRGR